MCEAGVHEAAIAAGGCTSYGSGIDKNDVARCVAFFRNDRCPQTGVTATDDTQVTALGTNEGGVCVRGVSAVKPVRNMISIRNCIKMPLVNCVVVDRHESLSNRECMTGWSATQRPLQGHAG